jgi:hypothetical protein
MKRILFTFFLLFSISAMAQKANDNCIIIRYSEGDALDKVRDGFSKEQLGALDISLSSVKEENKGNETVVTCRGTVENTSVTFVARVASNRVVLFASFNSDGGSKRAWFTGNESDFASFVFLKLSEMTTEHMFFPSDKIFYKNSSAPWNE